MGATAGEWLVRISVWVAIVCYPAGVFGLRSGPWRPTFRWIWTLGCLAFLLHTISSFHVFYNWSQQIALQETARQTAELTGVATGSGLYFNYLFALLWLADVLWWWARPDSWARRSTAWNVALHLFMFFILFNGSVVFARGVARWLGVAVTLLLAGWLSQLLRPGEQTS